MHMFRVSIARGNKTVQNINELSCVQLFESFVLLSVNSDDVLNQNGLICSSEAVLLRHVQVFLLLCLYTYTLSQGWL